jgi:putative SOS response-associated peptidase YedK
MCGRYYFEPGEDARGMGDFLARCQRLEHAAAMKRGEICPTDIAPVIVAGHRGGMRVALMRWGFRRADAKGLIINARSETAANKPMFRESMEKRRCLVPARCYYEWQKSGRERTRYAVHPEEDERLYMAGLYRLEQGAALPSFVILTCEAAGEIAPIHHRMPVMIAKEGREGWLYRGEGLGSAPRRLSARVIA